MPNAAPVPHGAQPGGAPFTSDTLLNLLQDAVIFTDPALRITGWNQAAEALYGWSATEALGQLAHELLQTDYLGADPSQLLQQVQTYGVWKGEVCHHHRDGHPITILTTVTWMRDPHGEAIGALSLNRDISERTRAEQAMQRATERLRILADASHAFAEVGADYHALLERIARISADRLHAACSIRLRSDDGQWLDVVAIGHYGPAEQQDMQASLISWRIHIDDRAPAAVAARTGEAQFMPVIDREALPATIPPEQRAILLRFFPHSLMVLPLRLHGRSIGSLMLARDARETPSFTADDLSLAQDLTDRAAQVIGNAQLLVGMQAELAERQHAERELQRSRDQLSILAEASRAFAATNRGTDALLDLIARHLVEALGGACMILLRSDDDRLLLPRITHDSDPEALALDREIFALHPLPIESAHPFAQVFRSGHPLLIPSIDPEQLRTQLQPAYWPAIDRLYVSSAVIAPLQVEGRSIGVLGLIRRQHLRPAFTEQDLQLVQNLADRAALAIANAQLYQQLQEERALLARRVAERTADLSLANAELTRATRLKDEFLASMSHELRTPLNSILGRSEALQEAIYGPVTPKQIASLQGIEESGRHLLALINDILDLSKIEAGQLDLSAEPLQLDLLCPLCLRMVAQMALSKRISLSSAYDSHVQTLVADERRLKQILVNLLANAVKFTPEGGKVGLELHGDEDAQTATFTVWDSGIGIAAENLPKLFQPFVQIDSSLSRQYTGTGLGLALVARLTSAHGGSVAVASTPGEGSRFQVTLPWSPAVVPARSAPETTVLPSTRPTISRAMVIEDSPTAAAQLTRYLHELGARVEVLPHGIGVIARAIALQPDVILLDILLPDDNGWQVLRQLKAEPRTQAIPVIIVSVVDQPERAQALGAAASLLKPIDRVGLEQTLHRVLTRQEDAFIQLAIVATPAAGRPKLLLAEDNEANIATFADYLRAKGYDLVIARNGGEAVVRAQEERPDAILMDIQMPGMDGLEAIRHIRADAGLAQIPIIAVTALAMPGDRERCLEAGADDYLTKPVQLQRLVALIESLRGAHG